MMNKFDDGGICAEVNVKKRGRLRQACNSCSRVKKKCDGGTPCSFCEKANLPCVYEERIRPGPPPKKSLNGSENSGYVSHGSDIQPGPLPVHQPIHHPPQPKHHSKPQPKSDCSISADELNFITIFLQNIHGNIPLINSSLVNDGISKIAFDSSSNSGASSQLPNRTPYDNEAIVSLTWSACCYGAYVAQDPRSESYLILSHKALQRCFDGASVLVAKAFFALELLLNIFSESSAGIVSQLQTRKGVYFGLGEAILLLSTTEKDVDCEIVWNLLRFWRTPPVLVGASVAEYWKARYPVSNMASNSNPVKHSHPMLQYWTSRLSEDVYQEDGGPIHSGKCDTMVESHIYGIQQDIRQIKLLEDSCVTQDTNPPTTVILHFSLSMHRLKLHQFERAFHGLKAVAAYCWMHPYIICTAQMWKMVYITRTVLQSSELTPVAMQASLRPLADDLFALLCHTGKLYGFQDLYSSNGSPILANLLKNVSSIMFPSTTLISETVAAYVLAGRNINNNVVSVLTMNGWLRLAQGEILKQEQISSQSNGDPPPLRLSSIAVPSSFIDKRISAPDKPISALIENRIMVNGSKSSRNELNRDTLKALDRSNDGMTSTSSFENSGEEYDTDERESKRRPKQGSTRPTKIRQTKQMKPEPVNWNNGNPPHPLAIQGVSYPNIARSGSGVDDLLSYMLNDEYIDYNKKQTNPAAIKLPSSNDQSLFSDRMAKANVSLDVSRPLSDISLGAMDNLDETWMTDIDNPIP